MGKRALRDAAVALAALAIAGCGRVAFDSIALAADSAPPADACAFGAWTPPTRVDELSTTAQEFGGQVSGDGLAYYFRSNEGGTSAFYVAHRASRTTPFDAPVLLAELSGSNDHFDISASDDELEVMFSSDRASPNTYCLFHADRASTAVPFTNITRLDATCAVTGSAGAYLVPDHRTLYYVRMDGPNYEGTLMRSVRASRADAFDAGTPIAELDDAGLAKGYPALSGDGLTLYFDAGNPHHLWEVSRTTPNGIFGTPRALSEFASTQIDEDVSITADGRELYFASERLRSPDDIFVTTRPCL